VVLASGGYPGNYEKGILIEGLEQIDRNEAFVFHAGTALKDGRHYTNGGRVLGVTALGTDRKEAREKAYRWAAKVRFDGVHYRTDIAK